MADWLEQPETLRSRLKKLPGLDETRLCMEAWHEYFDS